MLKHRVALTLLSSTLLTSLWSNISHSQIAEQHSTKNTGAQSTNTIRFYRGNKHEQKIRVNMPKHKTNLVGCHNFKRKKRIATVIQLGYRSCSLFTEKNCPAESTVKATHSKQDTYAKKLTSGYAWQIEQGIENNAKGIKIKSWYCE